MENVHLIPKWPPQTTDGVVLESNNDVIITTPSYNSTIALSNITGPFDYSCWILDDPPPLMLSHKIYLYTSLVFMVLGIVGNTLSILVFSSPGVRLLSSNVYLLVLAISDSTYLTSVFFSKIMTYIKCFFFPENNIDIYNQSAFFCKFLQYMQDLFSAFSTCVIMAFTFERYVAVYFPRRYKELCTVLRARAFCLAIFIVIGVFTIPYHIMYMHRYADYNMCTVKVTYEETFTILFAIESLLFRVTPVIIITILNVFIIIRVLNVRKQIHHRPSVISKRSGRNSIRSRYDKNVQLTVILTLISTTYVLTYIPVLVHFVIWKLQRSNLVNVSENIMLITRNYTRMIYIVGFAINFFFYTVSGSIFREQLRVFLFGKNYRLDSTQSSRFGMNRRNARSRLKSLVCAYCLNEREDVGTAAEIVELGNINPLRH